MQSEKQGIFAKQALTEDEMTEIQQLAVICNTFESLHIRLPHAKMFKTRSENEILDFLYYEEGRLVGYLGIDEYGSKEKDFEGMVHPEHRRKGIASRLLQAAKEEARHSGIEQLILTCEPSSNSGTAFAKAIHAHPAFSEHVMVLRTYKERPLFDERLTFRQAVSVDDLAMVASIMATDMGDIEQAKRYVADMTKQDNQRFYLMTFGGPEVGCDEAIGSLRVSIAVRINIEPCDKIDGKRSSLESANLVFEGLNLFEHRCKMEQRTGIYGFVVRPEYRGKGYGRQLLQEAIRIIRDEGSQEIMLDVDVDNTNALGLYLSCGFEIKTTYDYYSL